MTYPLAKAHGCLMKMVLAWPRLVSYQLHYLKNAAILGEWLLWSSKTFCDISKSNIHWVENLAQGTTNQIMYSPLITFPPKLAKNLGNREGVGQSMCSLP
jgi:hypothetical protein